MSMLGSECFHSRGIQRTRHPGNLCVRLRLHLRLFACSRRRSRVAASDPLTFANEDSRSSKGASCFGEPRDRVPENRDYTRLYRRHLFIHSAATHVSALDQSFDTLRLVIWSISSKGRRFTKVAGSICASTINKPAAVCREVIAYSGDVVQLGAHELGGR